MPVIWTRAILAAAALAAAGCGAPTDGPSAGTSVQRTATPAASPRPASVASATVPRTLADGRAPARVPRALARAFGKPVVLAARAAPGEFEGLDCTGTRSGRRVQALVTVEGLTLTTRSGRRLAACDATRRGSRWRSCGGITARDGREPQLAHAGGRLVFCERPGGRGAAAFVWFHAPRGTRWVAHDRGAYVAAFPVASGRLVRVTDTPPARSTYRRRFVAVGRAGAVLARPVVQGYVAG